MDTPLPLVTPETAPFWEGCNQGEVRYQRCERCAEVQLIPRALCSRCHATALTWHRAAGAGTVATFTVVKRAPGPFRDRAPYVIALVDMDERFRLMVNLHGAQDVAIGSRVRIVFRKDRTQALPEAEVVA